MKVNIKTSQKLDFNKDNISKGLLITKNPFGVIMHREDEGDYFILNNCDDPDPAQIYTWHQTSWYPGYQEEFLSFDSLIFDLINRYPNIEFEYIEEEK